MSFCKNTLIDVYSHLAQIVFGTLFSNNIQYYRIYTELNKDTRSN